MGNLIEIIIAVLIIASALFLFIKSIRKKSSGDCDCGNCTKSCCPPEHKTPKQIKK